MTDEEIIAVVSAHKEGKKIQYRWNLNPNADWKDMSTEEYSYGWNFHKWSYRVAPELPKPRDFWLCNGRDRSRWEIVDQYHNPYSCGGIMIHVIEEIGATSGEPAVISSSVKTSQETSPRKPREWIVFEDLGGKLHTIGGHTGPKGTSFVVREVLE